MTAVECDSSKKLEITLEFSESQLIKKEKLIELATQSWRKASGISRPYPITEFLAGTRI
jgi:hypothetical protein